MWSFIAFPFNWLGSLILFILIALHNRKLKGITAIGVACALQIGAFHLYWHQVQMVAGQPDMLYVWITPYLMTVLSIVAFIVGFVMNFMGVKRRTVTHDKTHDS